MQYLSHTEAESVSGGLPIWVPVTAALLSDTATWGTLAGAYTFGFAIGTGIYQTSTSPAETMPSSPYLDTMAGGNLGA